MEDLTKSIVAKMDSIVCIEPSDMDNCSSIDEFMNLKIDFMEVGAIKMAKFLMAIEVIEEKVIPQLTNEGIPLWFVKGQIQSGLIDWCNKYCDEFSERLKDRKVDLLEAKVERLIINKMGRIILDWNETI